MADNHQPPATPPATPPETPTITPRSQEPTPAPETGDAVEKAAHEAKERMTKTKAFWNRLSPEKEEEKPEKSEKQENQEKEQKTEKIEKPVAATPAQTPEPEAKAKPEKKPRKEKEEIDPIELARATGQEIAREIAKANKPATAQPATPAVEPELPEEFRAETAVFEEMARLDPKKYSNIKKELAVYAQKEDDYRAKWEDEHPDTEFDPDAPEHNSFYSKIQPKYDQKDFRAAEKSLLKQELRKEVTEDLKSREAEVEQRRERAAKIEPEVTLEMRGALGDMVREIDPDNAELAKDWASMQTLDEKNPLLSDVMVEVHNEIKPVMVAAVRVFRSIENPDPNNPIHSRIFDLIWKAEADISRQPIKDRYDKDGRLFATQADYSQMSPAEQKRHWYIGEQEAVWLIRRQAIAQTKTLYEKKKQEIERYTKRQNAAQPNNSPPTEKQETPPPARPDNGSPSVSGRGTLPGDGQSGSNKPTSGRDLFFGRHLSA